MNKLVALWFSILVLACPIKAHANDCCPGHCCPSPPGVVPGSPPSSQYRPSAPIGEPEFRSGSSAGSDTSLESGARVRSDHRQTEPERKINRDQAGSE